MKIKATIKVRIKTGGELAYCVYEDCRLPACCDGEIEHVDDECVYVERLCIRHGWRIVVGRLVAKARGRIEAIRA